MSTVVKLINQLDLPNVNISRTRENFLAEREALEAAMLILPEPAKTLATRYTVLLTLTNGKHTCKHLSLLLTTEINRIFQCEQNVR